MSEKKRLSAAPAETAREAENRTLAGIETAPAAIAETAARVDSAGEAARQARSPAAAAQQAAREKIESLLNLHPKIVDLSLTRMEILLDALGNPHLRLPPVIHIAGTNGKGSAAAFSRAFLEAAGYSVHVYTSPHLVNWHERFRLGYKTAAGAPASAFADDALLAEMLAEVSRAAKGNPVTVFEILTAAAFALFARFPADALALEVGLGGRFDATNIIPRPQASLIMPIGFDHQAFLGDSIAQIAAEKAGIIKRGCPAVSACQTYPEAEQIFRRRAGEMQAPLSLFGRDYQMGAEGEGFLFANDSVSMRLPKPRLNGAFQPQNAAAALQAVLRGGFAVSERAAQAAMANVLWPARLQKLDSGSLRQGLPPQAELWLDGGHNPAAAEKLAPAVAELAAGRPLYMVCAMLQTKDAAAYLRCFAPLRSELYAVPMHSAQAAVPPLLLTETARQAGIKAQTAPSLRAALAEIAAKAACAAKPPFILICGSLYLAGEALRENGAPPR